MTNNKLALATNLLQSGLLPQHIKTAQQAFAIITMGQELGLGPWASLNSIFVVHGKPSLSGAAIMALLQGSGLLEDWKHDDDGETATVKMKRIGQETWHEATFSQADAERAGLARKDTWRQYPSTMRMWRAITLCARPLFADALHGFGYTPEELGEDYIDASDTKDYDPAQIEAEINPGMAQGGYPDEAHLPASAFEADPIADPIIECFNRGKEQFAEEWTEEERGKAVKELAIRIGDAIGIKIYTKDLGDGFYQGIGLSRTDTIREARLTFAGQLCGRGLGSYKDMTDAELYALRGIVDYLSRKNLLIKTIEDFIA